MIDKIKSVYRFISPKFQTLHLDYKVSPMPRYGHGNPPHPMLHDLINQNRTLYKENIESFLNHTNNIQNIKNSNEEKDENNPAWNNGFLPGLDIIGIYGMIAKYKPSQYIEIGSGNSTKVARKSITENNLNTQITSIDPFPRANIDHLADKVIRMPFESLPDNKFIIDTLQENDILFIDNSHRILPNSDVMVCFMELLPFLKKGVIVHIHDIYLPFDYPQFMCDRFYSEQYMLAMLLLANSERFKPILPNYFISQDKEISKIIEPIWNHPNMQTVETHGDSFWLQID
ncbi:MAG: class I SAM-dependent methyltransferase [Bacteroidetes bacterium]|nr:class I SAM-dependent methyltransferase [Bacteroidota bacterium]